MAAAQAEARSATSGDMETVGVEPNNLIISRPTESSFTALLGLPAKQAMELLVQAPSTSRPPPPIFPEYTTLVDPGTKFSTIMDDWVKQEPAEDESNSDPNSAPFSNDPKPSSTTKRKGREKKGKEACSRKSRKAAYEKTEEGGEKLPYVHVRARRGQATDTHSLAERVRREKINARMKLLQDLVPGCNKITGTAMVLDEIINHVQSLQRQVEFLSMSLAAVNPRLDFNLDTLMAAESGSTGESNYQNVTAMPPFWAEGHMQANRQEFQQQWYLNGLDHNSVWSGEEDTSIFITQDNSVPSYDSSGNSVAVPLLSNQLKMEM